MVILDTRTGSWQYHWNCIHSKWTQRSRSSQRCVSPSWSPTKKPPRATIQDFLWLCYVGLSQTYLVNCIPCIWMMNMYCTWILVATTRSASLIHVSARKRASSSFRIFSGQQIWDLRIIEYGYENTIVTYQCVLLSESVCAIISISI